MASDMRLPVTLLLTIAVIFANVTCQETTDGAQLDTSAKQQQQNPGAVTKTTIAGLPIIITRQNGTTNKPDFWLGWTNWQGMGPLKPMIQPYTEQISPFTQELSKWIMEMVPGAAEAYHQINTIGDQASALMPVNMLPNLGSNDKPNRFGDASKLEAGARAGAGAGAGAGSGSGNGNDANSLPGYSGISQILSALGR